MVLLISGRYSSKSLVQNYDFLLLLEEVEVSERL